MATRSQDVELRIRATDFSKKTTDQVVDSLKALAAAQNENVEAAKRGTASAKELAAGYDKIEAAAKALVSQRNLVKTFDDQNIKLAETKTRLDSARAAQAAYVGTLDATIDRTKKEEAALAALAKSVGAAERAFTRIEDNIAKSGARLARFGIDSNNSAAAQAKITAAITLANGALERQEGAITGLSAAQARRQARLEAEAVAQRRAADEIVAARNRERVADQAWADSIDNTRRAQEAQNAATRNAQQNLVAELNNRIALSNQIRVETDARLAQARAISAAAAAADAAARSAATVARGRAPVTGPVSLAGTIADIAAPSAAAVRNVNGLEAAIRGLETRVSTISGPVRGYRDALREATEAQRALSTIAGQVDTFNRQVAAVRAARAEYVNARSAVAALTAQLRAGTGGDDITQRLARSQATLRGAAGALGEVTTAARGTQAALDAAGIRTNNLTAAQQQLIAQAQRAAAATNALTSAYQRNGGAADQAGSRIFNWFGGANGRTTLSYTQRLRGELFGLAASFIGINSAVSGATDTLDSFRQKQAIQSKLLIVSGGDARAAAEEYEYLRNTADRLGFEFSAVAGAYAKFAIATKTAGFTNDQLRFTFENVAKAATNAKLSTSDFEGILKAFEQIVSKGKVSAEELRGQLGDRLPGAFQIAAAAAKLSVADYTKAVEAGERSSEDVIGIARRLGEVYGVIGEAGNGLVRAEAIFKNTLFDFQNAIAEGGAVTAYQEFLEKLTTIISGDSGTELAGKLATGFKAVLDVLIFLIENIDTLIDLLKALAALKVVQWLFGLKAAFFAVKAEVILLNAQLVVANGWIAGLFIKVGALAGRAGLGALATALGGVGVALGALGQALLRAIPIVGAVLLAVTAIKFGWDYFFGTDKDAEDAGRKAAEAANRGLNKAGRPGTSATKDPGEVDTSAAGYAKVQAQLEKDRIKLEESSRDIRLKGAQNNLAERKKIIDEEYEALRKTARDTIKDKGALESAIFDINASSNARQLQESQRFAQEQHKVGETAANRREKLALDLNTKLLAAEADLARDRLDAEAATVPFDKRREAQVKASLKAYDDIKKKLEQRNDLTADEKLEFEIRYKQIVAIREEEVRRNATRQEAVRLEKEFNKELEIQKAKKDAIATKVATGELSPEEALAATNEVTAQTSKAIDDAGAKAINFANSVRELLDPVAYVQLLANISRGLAQNNAAAVTSADNIIAAQKRLNTEIERRDRAEQAIRQQRELGLISVDEESKRLNENNEKFKKGILDNAAALKVFLEAAKAAGLGNKEELDKVSAATDKVIEKVKNTQQEASTLQNIIVSGLGQAGTVAFDALGDAIGDVVAGQASLAEGFRNAGVAAGLFFAKLLKDIALAIIKQQILNALASFGGGIGGAAVKAGGVVAGGRHNGGTIGRSPNTFSRTVSPQVFAGAQKFHNGGLPGLRPDEVALIGQKGEEMLSRDDPRNILNGGAAAGAGGAGASVRVVLLDERSKVAEAMASSEGEAVIMQTIKRNLPTIKQYVRS